MATATWGPSKMEGSMEKVPMLTEMVTSTQDLSITVNLKESVHLSNRRTENLTLGHGRPTRRVAKERGRKEKKATQVLSKTIFRMAMASGRIQLAIHTKATSRTICSMDKAFTSSRMGSKSRVNGAWATYSDQIHR